MLQQYSFSLILILVTGLIVAGCSDANNGTSMNEAEQTAAKKHFPAQDLIGQSIDDMPDTNFVNQDREHVDFAELPNHPILMSFIYTRCPMSDMCPLITRKMKKVQSNVGSSGTAAISLVTITFDPAYDTPAVLKSYAKSREVNLSNWDFVTGPETVVDDLVSRFKISTKTVEDDRIIHNLRTYLIDGNHRIVEWYRGSDWTVETVTNDIRERLN